MKIIAIALLSIVIGAASTFIYIYYYFESEASKFIDSQISVQERISVDAFNHNPIQTSNFTQMNYNILFKKAFDAGLIDEFEYHRAASFANTRLCISYEDADDLDQAERFCKWAAEHLSQWRDDLGFNKFKEMNIESRRRKEIPSLSLEIINKYLGSE